MRRYLERIAHGPDARWWLQAHQQSAAEFVDTLLDLSSGNWLYLSHLIAEMRRGPRDNYTVYGLPASLANYYAAYAATWRDKDAQKWDTLYAPVFVTLVAAREPITLDRLIEWSGVSASRQEVRRLLREEWRPWVVERQDPIKGTLYTLYHPSLTDFVLGKANQRDLTITTLHVVDDLQAHLRVIQRRIVEYFHQQCNGDWAQLAGHAYADQHLAHHLEQVQGQGTKPLRNVALAAPQEIGV
jgi:hypothetical protein